MMIEHKEEIKHFVAKESDALTPTMLSLKLIAQCYANTAFDIK